MMQMAIPATGPRSRRQRSAPTWWHTLFLWILAAVLIVAVAACGSDPVGPFDQPTFLVEVSGETFVIQVADADQIAALDDRLAAGGPGVVNGALVSGDGGFMR